MAQTDVLVCGKCHNVFHFVELFREHKDQGCDMESNFKDCVSISSELLRKRYKLNPRLHSEF